MVTATPSNVGEVVRQLLNEALAQAAEQPQHLSDLFDQVENDANKIVDEAKQIPDEIARKLNDRPFHPPDWWSLLVFLVVKVHDLIGDPRLTVGYRHPGGWSRMLTLNYYSEDPANPGATILATVGVAVTDPDVTHGIWLQVVKDFDLNLGTGTLHVAMSAKGRADWQYVLGAAMTKPGQQAAATIDIQWTPWDADVKSGVFTFTLGPIHLRLALSSPADPLYSVTIGLGTEGASGIEATVNASQALGDALSSFIDIAPIDESYSPQLVLIQGASPQFSLGHRGSA
jgi:hypothetical protein